LPWLERSLALSEATHGPEHPETARHLRHLGMIENVLGRKQSAIARLRRAVEIREKTEKPTGLQTAEALTALGIAQDEVAPAEAAEHLERAIRILEQAVGPEHPTLVRNLPALASLLSDAGQLDQAVSVARRAVDLGERTTGKTSLFTGMNLRMLSGLLMHVGEVDEACATIERSLAIVEKEAPGHSDMMNVLMTRGDCLMWKRDLAAAEATLERALAIGEASLGPSDPKLAYSLHALSEVLVARGKPELAVSTSERAMALLPEGKVDPLLRAQAELKLGVALRAAGQAERAAPLIENASRILLESSRTTSGVARRARAPGTPAANPQAEVW
jgi:tetratricopeptide (TPR) repeat protein